MRPGVLPAQRAGDWATRMKALHGAGKASIGRTEIHTEWRPYHVTSSLCLASATCCIPLCSQIVSIGCCVHYRHCFEMRSSSSLAPSWWVLLAHFCCRCCRHPRVLALPHMGSATDEVYERFATVLCENITRVKEGRELLHRLC